MMSRNVTPRPDMQRKLGIIASSQDEVSKAAIRDTCPCVLRNGMDHITFAAADEYFANRLADRLTLRDGIKVALALGASAYGEIEIAERSRLTENRTRHSDIVVEGKCPNQRRRCIRIYCEVAGELNPRFQFNHGNKSFKYLVEQFDLLPRITSRPRDKQIGDAR